MDYQEFRKAFIAQFEEEIYQKNANIELGFAEIEKNNGVTMDGIILKGDSEVTPVVYANQLYQDYENGSDVGDIVGGLLQSLERDTTVQDFDMEQSMNWEVVKEKVIFHVLGAEKNQERQGMMPCRKEQDLLIGYRVLHELRGEGMSTYMVTNAMQKIMGVTEEELYQAAASNMPRLMPLSFENMNDIMIEMTLGISPKKDIGLDESLSMMEKEDGMYVLSNSEKCYGAATIFYPEVMDKIAQAFDRDMVVLPSSVHEAILMPYMPDMNLDEVKAMVMEINATQVAPEEVLTDQVYVYDKKEERLVIGEEWNQQRAEKERKPKQSLRDSLKEKKEQVTKPSNPAGKGAVDMEH